MITVNLNLVDYIFIAWIFGRVLSSCLTKKIILSFIYKEEKIAKYQCISYWKCNFLYGGSTALLDNLKEREYFFLLLLNIVKLTQCD